MKLFALFLLLVVLKQTCAQSPVVITYAGGYNGNVIDTKKIEVKN